MNDPVPPAISPSDIQRAMHRAVSFKRQQAIDAGVPEGNITEMIHPLPYREARPTRREHLYCIGTIVDTINAVTLRVWLHELTQQVQVERPREIDIPNPPPSVPALIMNLYGPKRYEADDRYVYELDGVEYSAEEAERIAEERKSVQGWTWRLKDG